MCETDDGQEHLYAHRVTWPRLLLAIVTVLFYIVPWTKLSPNPSINYLAIAIAVTAILSGLALYFLMRAFHDDAVPPSFLIDQAASTILPTYVLLTWLQSTLTVVLIAAANFVTSALLFANGATNMNERPPEEQMATIFLGIANAVPFVTSATRYVVHNGLVIPITELIKWRTVRHYHTVNLLPRNAAKRRFMGPNGVLAVASVTAWAFALLPAMDAAKLHAEHLAALDIALPRAVFPIAVHVVVRLLLDMGSILALALVVSRKQRRTRFLSVAFVFLLVCIMHGDYTVPPELTGVEETVQSTSVPTTIGGSLYNIERFTAQSAFSMLNLCVILHLFSSP